MILRNNIGWCDVTGNQVIGCTKVSPACTLCYAAEDAPARVLRFRGVETWGPNGQRQKVGGFAARARKLNRFLMCDSCRETQRVELGSTRVRCLKCGGDLRRIRLFADSNSDWLDDKWEIDWLAEYLSLIHECGNLDWLLLTKRPENWKPRLMALLRGYENDPAYKVEAMPREYDLAVNWLCGDPPANVWLGATVEDNERRSRVNELRAIPAVVRFLSCEPLLAPVQIGWALSPRVTASGLDASALENPAVTRAIAGSLRAAYRDTQGVDWVICGGESGKGARPMHPDWARSLRDQCAAAGVPFFFKQRGEWSWACEADYLASNDLKIPGDWRDKPDRYRCMRADGSLTSGYDGTSAEFLAKVGKRAAGRLLDGREHNNFPSARAASPA